MVTLKRTEGVKLNFKRVKTGRNILPYVSTLQRLSVFHYSLVTQGTLLLLIDFFLVNFSVHFILRLSCKGTWFIFIIIFIGQNTTLKNSSILTYVRSILLGTRDSSKFLLFLTRELNPIRLSRNTLTIQLGLFLNIS